MIWAILGIIVVVSAIIGGIYALGRSHGKTSYQNATMKEQVDALIKKEKVAEGAARATGSLGRMWSEGPVTRIDSGP